MSKTRGSGDSHHLSDALFIVGRARDRHPRLIGIGNAVLSANIFQILLIPTVLWPGFISVLLKDFGKPRRTAFLDNLF